MCLGVPGKVIAIDGLTATVDFWGIRRQVRLELVDQPVAPGDYILNHVGFAIRRIPEEDIQGTLALYEELLADVTRSDDLMATDVRGEIHGAGAVNAECQPPLAHVCERATARLAEATGAFEGREGGPMPNAQRAGERDR